MLHYRGRNNINEGGVGFLVHKQQIQNIKEIQGISLKVIYLIYQLVEAMLVETKTDKVSKNQTISTNIVYDKRIKKQIHLKWNRNKGFK